MPPKPFWQNPRDPCWSVYVNKAIAFLSNTGDDQAGNKLAQTKMEQNGPWYL